jgi:hypothetical protein
LSDKYAGKPERSIPDEEAQLFSDTMREFGQYRLMRDTTASQWQEIAELIMVSHSNTFYYGNDSWPGQKKTQRQIDSSGMMALSRFAAICDSLLTPRNMFWHQLGANDDYVMKDRATRLWFEQVTKILFKYRYAPIANFAAQNQANYQSLGAFGTGSMFVDVPHKAKGLRYRAPPLGETFFRENHQGLIDGCIRWFKMTAHQAETMWPGMLPGNLRSALAGNSQTKYNFLHHVCPREDYDKNRLDYKGKPFRSYYVCIEGNCLMYEEGEHYESGYHTFPYAASRYEQAPNETYGRSPAMLVLPALKTLNAQKAVFLKQGHRAADPVLLTADDGLIDFSMRPGALNKGGMSSEGKRLVDILPTGNIQVNEKMMDMERNLINDAFLVTLFQILTETPQMTATEVIERTNEKGILLAPTVGRQQSEYLGPMIDRELDVLASQRLLPPMPPRLREAQGEYSVVYTSPLSRAQRAQEAAGFMRTVESVKELVNITQDPSLLDPFDFDTAIPAIAEIQAVPESWMADPKKIQAKRQNRAKQQQAQQQVQAMPAQAAIMKAQAVQAKAGMGQQQPQQGQLPPPQQQQGIPQ